MDFVPQIEKGVPIPVKKQAKPRLNHEWLDKMEVGDSVVVPTAAFRSASMSAAYRSRKTGKKFLARKIDAAQRRIWRTA